jgi:hypothetical protein
MPLNFVPHQEDGRTKMNTRAYVLFITAFIGMSITTVHGQPKNPAASVADSSAAAASSAGSAATAPSPKPSEATNSAASVDLQQMARDIASISSKLDRKDYMPVLLGLGGSFVGLVLGAFVTFRTQRRLLSHQKELATEAAKSAADIANAKASHDESLASARAKLEIGNSFVQWQLKQLSELYGPLLALFRQSQALYRHMNQALAKSAPHQFRLVAKSDTDSTDNQEFEICIDGQWVRFRTVLHLDHAYGKDHGVEGYFDSITAISERIVKVIQANAGYARPEDDKLVDTFGDYLAHQIVLDQIVSYYKKRGSDPQSSKPSLNVDASAAFPAQIQKLVLAGHSAISAQLSGWRAKATS